MIKINKIAARYIQRFLWDVRLWPLRLFHYFSSSMAYKQRVHVLNDLTAFQQKQTTYTFDQTTDLPPQQLPENLLASPNAIEQCIHRRRSQRTFDEKPIAHAALEKLLYFSSGMAARTQTQRQHHYPSAGGLFPVETFLAVFNVAGLNPGLYAYNNIDNTLCQIQGDEYNALLLNYFQSTQGVTNIAACFALVGNHYIPSLKYGNRAYRYLLMETGHIMQNLYLLATSHNLAFFSVGGFSETIFNKLFQLNSKISSTLYLGLIGSQ